MQVKKEQVRLSLLKKAEKEFLEKGFKNSSLRKIVKSAGTTIGNFYNYFENKETLFEELVEEEYNNFLELIEKHNDEEGIEEFLDTEDLQKYREVLSEIIQNIIPVFSEKFVLLIEGSEGTKFEGTKDIIIKLLKDHFIEHIQKYESKIMDLEMAEITAEQFLNGIILIVKKYKDKVLRHRLITEHILFYISGMMAIIGK
ncbi:TetR/AcrR family transcriptional regulator [Clostridium sp. D2Q-11]|uniref:TetR/AcrR family transcriptional regulator n=1 Tax=Anaeromonas frigoriresistens TaxID=2683708 RepID=A0A942Z9P3_9FIRM|nr:TetR/AcrR family transcriptional regulator [Anaeromonas frigoriresistens]MBS4539364.1 TetR/AcrR family transcriptional regulator [Anaeromonas frigoriresistens]